MQKHFFCNFRTPLLLHQKPINKSYCFNSLFGRSFFLFCFSFFKHDLFWDPFTIQWAPTRDKQIDQAAKYCWTNRHATLLGPSRTTQIHAETPSGLGLRCFRYFSCFLFSTFSSTSVPKYMISIFSAAPNTSRNAEQMGPPKSNGRQNGSQNKSRGSIC